MSEFQQTKDEDNLPAQAAAPEGARADSAASTTFNDEVWKSAHVGADDAADAPAPAPATAPPPSQSTEGVTHKLTVDGEGVKMDQMGPMIINSDGSVRRIANWDQMNPQEQASAWRLISRRNERRRAELLAAAEEARAQAELHGIPEGGEEEDEEEPAIRALPPAV